MFDATDEILLVRFDRSNLVRIVLWLSRVTPQELRERTRKFAIAVQRFCRPLLKEPESHDAARQAIRSSASVAANYRAVCLARSKREFIAKVGLVLEEADECLFWLQYLRESGSQQIEIDALIDEARQLTAIFGASRRTAVRNAADQTPTRESRSTRRNEPPRPNDPMAQ
jgi:four helix bundle protein